MKYFFLCLFSLFGLASCSVQEPPISSASVTVRFSLPIVGADACPESLSTRALLVQDTKVRVVVYKSGDLSRNGYVTEKIFAVGADGTTLTAVGDELRLMPGTYDFYAITPELPVDHTGTIPTVNVVSGRDFAVSLTSTHTVSINSASGAVTLTELKRQSVRLTLSVVADANATVGNVKLKKLVINGGNIIGFPIFLKLTGVNDLPLGTSTNSFTLNGDWFNTDDDTPLMASGDVFLLPKRAGKFTLWLEVSLTLMDDNVVNAMFGVENITDLGFLSGHTYTLKATLSRNLPEVGCIGGWVLTDDIDASDMGLN